MNNTLLQCIAQKLKEQHITLERILWLDAVGNNFESVLEDVQEIFEDSEASIIQSIGRELWNEIMPPPDEMVSPAELAEELVCRKGWVVEVFFNLPDIREKIVFKGKKPVSWKQSVGVQSRDYYAPTLEAALCRALIWTARERRRAFRKAWEAQHDAIKPCPFCGSGEVVATEERGYNSHIVMCNECLCRTDTYESKEDAIEAWNRRPDSDE